MALADPVYSKQHEEFFVALEGRLVVFKNCSWCWREGWWCLRIVRGVGGKVGGVGGKVGGVGGKVGGVGGKVGGVSVHSRRN